MSNSKKEFVLRFDFKKAWLMKKTEHYTSEEEDHFGIKWWLRVTRDDQFLYVDLGKSGAGSTNFHGNFNVRVESDNGIPDTSSPVTTKEEYAVVFRNDLQTDQRLNPEKRSIGIFYSGEVDCLDRHGNMLELKTQKGELGHGFYKYSKSFKWWLQSSLVNVDHIIVGLRTQEGHVKSFTSLRTREIPQRASWNFRAGFEFLSTIFTYILNCLEKDGDACVIEYRSEMGIHKGIQMRRVPVDEFDFVPNEFLEKFC